MLAALTGRRIWAWSAFGKHPVARDFFRIGAEHRLTAAFCGWLENGYRLVSQTGGCPPYYSWRFWAKGIQKGEILVGLLKGSSDSIGRCYPLMIAGVGPLKEWEKVWDLLPFSCETVWGRMEYVASRGYPDLETLKDEIVHLPAPSDDWRTLEGERTRLSRETSWDDAAAGVLGSPAGPLTGGNRNHVFFPVDPGMFNDHLTRISFWCHLVRRLEHSPPNALFIGGNSSHTFFSIYRRSLAREDFAELCVSVPA